ncbi:MAG: stage III sporulation protein AB [Candidatus Ventricola sp.]
MVSWDVAVMAMIGISALGFLIADGEKRRVRWIQAMRRCLLRLNGMIRYEQPELTAMLRAVELRATPQERELTRLLHACAARMENASSPQLLMLFAGESARVPGYGVLSEEDRSAFEAVLGELGRTRLHEQISLIDAADERLRAREETLRSECQRRSQLIRTLGMACGAAVFLILI